MSPHGETIAGNIVSPTPLATAGSLSQSKALRILWWLALGLVVLAEYQWLAIRHDTGILQGRLLWSQLVGATPQLFRVAIATFAAFAIVGGKPLLDVWNSVDGARRGNSLWALWLALHLLFFASFSLCSDLVFRPETGTASTVWVQIAWSSSLLGLGACWFLSAMPPAVWIDLGWHCRWAIASAVVAGGAGWWAGELVNRIWPPLAHGTFYIAAFLLQMIYSDVVSRPGELEIGTTNFTVIIAPECSGYEGIGLIAVFLLLFLWVFRSRLRFPQVLVLLPLGITAVWLLNAVRIAALIVVGTSWSPEVALGGFHSQAGWLLFNGVALGLMAISLRIPALARNTANPGPALPAAQVQADNSLAYLGPFLAAVAAGMIASCITSDVQLIGASRMIAAVGVLWVKRKAYDRTTWAFSIWPLLAGGAVFAVWILLLPSGDSSQQTPSTDVAVGASLAGLAAWTLRLIGYAVVTPVVEELAFRGYLLRRFVSSDFESVPLRRFSLVPILLSSVLFGALHGTHWLPGIVAGLVFSLILVRRGSLVDAIVAHAGTNGLLAAYSVVTGNEQAWS